MEKQVAASRCRIRAIAQGNARQSTAQMDGRAFQRGEIFTRASVSERDAYVAQEASALDPFPGRHFTSRTAAIMAAVPPL